jgi:hypothetical protein
MKTMQTFRKKLTQLARHPRYPGRYARSESFAGSWAYFRASEALRRGEARRRREIVRSWGDVAVEEGKIQPEVGFRRLALADHPVVQAAVAAGRERLAGRLYANAALLGNKAFLQSYALPLAGPEDAPFLALAMLPEILRPICDYLGMYPVLQTFALCYSPNDDFEGSSQLFHFDHVEYRQIKVFVHLDEVDSATGPLTAIPAGQSRALFDELHRASWRAYKGQRLKDRALETSRSPHEIHQFTGPAGTVHLIDTCNCYHYGSRPLPTGSRPRKLMILHYTTPFAANMPAQLRDSDATSPEALLLQGRHAIRKRANSPIPERSL